MSLRGSNTPHPLLHGKASLCSVHSQPEAATFPASLAPIGEAWLSPSPSRRLLVLLRITVGRSSKGGEGAVANHHYGGHQLRVMFVYCHQNYTHTTQITLDFMSLSVLANCRLSNTH